MPSSAPSATTAWQAAGSLCPLASLKYHQVTPRLSLIGFPVTWLCQGLWPRGLPPWRPETACHTRAEGRVRRQPGVAVRAEEWMCKRTGPMEDRK